MPEVERRREPAFDNYRDLPVLELGGGTVQVFMGELSGVKSPARAFSLLVGAEIRIDANGSLPIPLNRAWEHALIVIEGALHYLGTHRDGVELTSKITTRAVLIGGAPFGESIVIWWNFVARTTEELLAAREDWEAGRVFGEVKAYQGPRLAAPEFVGRPIPSR